MSEMVDSWMPKIGDRVVLKPIPNWLQPYRRFAEEGRGATITATGIKTFGREQVRIEFDVKRKGAKPYFMFAYADDLSRFEPLNPPS